MVRTGHNHRLENCAGRSASGRSALGVRLTAASIGIEEVASTANMQQPFGHKRLATMARQMHHTYQNNAAMNVLNDALKDRHALFDRGGERGRKSKKKHGATWANHVNRFNE